MFEVACTAVGCAPSEMLHLGDSLATDVAGANGVGAVSVWLNHEGQENRSGVTPDHVIHSLGEVLDLLGVLG